jgi:hypothetical protein
MTATGTIDPIFQDPSIPWAIDMDGTLIREDVTELAFAKSVRNPFYWYIFIYALLLFALRSVPHGQRFLETRFIADPIRLSYNLDLMSLIQGHRQRGGQAILATASHHEAARPVAEHVRLFDHVIGSSPPAVMDARAEEKARLLDERYPNGFVYAGNSKDDLKVWHHAGCKGMLLVNCKPGVLHRARQIRKPYIVIP